MNNRLTLASLVPLVLALCSCGSGEQKRFVTIGTGGMTGVYYPTGQAIATIVNEQQATYGIRASAESTGGSVYNINAVLSGDLDFGIAQSDRQYQAWHGEGDWEGNPRKELRAVFSLHPEVVTLVAADDSGIQTLQDLRGKRVNIGNPGSGHRGNALDILAAAGLDPETDLMVESLKASEAPKMLQDGRIDAFFYTVGHPNGAMNEVTAGKRKVHFVPITGMEALLEASPFYAKAVIPGDLYPMATGQGDVESIGMVTTLVTSSAVPDDIVYAVVKEVLSNLDTFRKLHPALAHLSEASVRSGASAPYHPGALKYFEEQGLPGR